MKINFFKSITLIFLILITLIIYLSVIGIETDKFNNQVKKKIINTDRNLDLELKKINLTLDLINFRVNAKTIGTKIFYSKKLLPLEYIKTQISLSSLIKKKIISSNIEVATRSILLKDLIKFIRAVDNSPQLFIAEQIIKKGQIILDLKFNFDQNGKIADDYEIKGSLKDGKIDFLKDKKIENINFDFNLVKDNFSFNELRFTNSKINFSSELLNVKKKDNVYVIEGILENKKSNLDKNFIELFKFNVKDLDLENVIFSSKNEILLKIDNKFNFKDIVLNSKISFDKLKFKKSEIIESYFTDINDFILLNDHILTLKYDNNKLLITGKGKILLEEAEDNIQYQISKSGDVFAFSSDLTLENINLKSYDFLKNFFPLINDKISLRNQNLNITIKNNDLFLTGTGKIKIDKNFDKIDYSISKKNNNLNFDVDLNLEKTKFQITQLNYQKKNKTISQLKIKGNFKENESLKFETVRFSENKNRIELENFLLTEKNLIIGIDKAIFDYIDNENKKNFFKIIKKKTNKYEFFGLNFNANTLITNLLNDKSEKENKFFENDINLDLDIKELNLDKIYFVKNLKGNLYIKENKINNANFSGNFKDNEKIIFSIKSDKEGGKVTTLTSSWAKPLIKRYKFIKGFEDGYLDFYSIKKNGVSTSKLIIDNFKVKEIPALAKLLALASLQGIADLLTGEGIRFTDLEMKFSNQKKLMKIEELYAIGPSISILMEGYIETDKLISLRGTLVPASTINRSISSIPLIGDFLVGKKVGEGVFGVSFKIKGPPKNLETTVNPIKTLTPRFITRTLEKIKKN